VAEDCNLPAIKFAQVTVGMSTMRLLLTCKTRYSTLSHLPTTDKIHRICRSIQCPTIMGRLAIIEVSQETMQMLIIWEVQECFS
jgi:hypothetical protein